MNQISLSDPERATILAALRYLQNNQRRAMSQVGEIATNLGQFHQPTDPDIDGLCAKLNGGSDDDEPDFEEFSVPVLGDPDYHDAAVEHWSQA
jgi:hypothetical protein